MTASSRPLSQPRNDERHFDRARQPLYVALARSLTRDIGSGRYAVGSTLPPEDQLAQHYRVSRHTVRQALRELKDDGIVWARAGIGTIVRTRPDTPRFFSSIKTAGDLLQFVDATEMHLVSRGEAIADQALAGQLHCEVGEAWTEVTILRKVPQQAPPLGYLQVYLRPDYAGTVGPEEVFTRPIYSMIEERCGVHIAQVRQEVTASNLDSRMAKALQAKEGQAAMRITRFYVDRAGAIAEVSIGHYPGGRYTQRSRFRAQSAEEAGAGHG